MWILFRRAARPDAAYWPGRRWLAVVDALAWPTVWLMAVLSAPMSTGIAGRTVMALAVLTAVRRSYRALWSNERYWFTTWRWGVPLATLLLFALATGLFR
jgi:hypothetical protein